MKTTHTPGPWTLEAGRNIKTQSGEFYITYGKDTHGNPLFRDFCELDRNARLIAAAPDLLAAIEHCIDWFNAAGLDVPALAQAIAAQQKAMG